jgi:hypothetical protein
MTHPSREDLFRKAAEAEGGLPVSAGARVAHVRLAEASGRLLYVDLTGVPEDRRAAVAAEIKELVLRASAKPVQAPESTTVANGDQTDAP